MRKRLLSSMLFLLGMTMGLHAQSEVKVIEDVTSKVQNADFSQGDAVTTKVCTYDYDMADQGAGAGGTSLFGQQPVTGWIAAFPSDNIKQMENSSSTPRTDGANTRASGLFAYPEEIEEGVTPGLGGAYYAPLADEVYTGQGLGMVTVWGGAVQYTQEVTLPAGDYMMVVTLQNTAGGSAMLNSFMGFAPAEGNPFYSTRLEFPAGSWETDTIYFRLTAETAGALSLGYKSGNYGSSGAYHLFIDNVKLYTIETNVIDQQKIDEAKALLLEQIKIGEDREADTSAAQDVYDNPNATLEEVLAAIEAQKELNEQAITDLSAFFIKNAHFSLDDPIEDGICTYDYDMKDPNGANGGAVTHYGMQPVTGWTASNPSTNTEEGVNNGRASGVFAIGGQAWLGGKAFLPPTSMSDGETEGKLLGFISVWTAKSQYTQRVSLPVGRYTLTFSYYNGGGSGTVSKNLMGFVADDGTEYLGTTTTFTAGKWLQESVKFEIEEPTAGYFTMGYTAADAGSGSMPHLFVDGVSLNYVGTGINASLFALSAAISTGEEALEKEFFTDLKDQLQDAVDKAQELLDNVSDDEAANTAAADAISNMIDVVNKNIAAYESLQFFYDGELADALNKYDAENYPSINEYVSKMKDEVEDALNDLNWDTAKIEEVMASLRPWLKEEIKKLFDAAVASGEQLAVDLDISVLFDQMAYTYSTNAVSGSNVPDKEWKYGDAGNFKTQYGTAEVWNQSPFEVSRTLADMPAGKYTISTKAFYRTAANADNYASYDPEGEPVAFVFAGNVKTGLTNVAEIASRDGAELEGWVAIDEDGGDYVPNSQLAAYNLFNNEEYANLEKSVTTGLTKAGDLTFGVKADQMDGNCWVVWYSFSLTYNALDAESANAELQGLIAEAQTYTEDETVLMVEKAVTNLNDAIGQGENALYGTIEEKNTAIDALQVAIDYAKQGVELVSKLTDQINFFNDLVVSFPEISSADQTLNDILSYDGGFESNEQIQSTMDSMPKAWTAYVLGQDMTGASQDAPVDLSGLLFNPYFDLNNANYWECVAAVDTLEDGTKDRIGQNQGYQNNSVYTNDEEGVEINQFIEAWRPNGEALHDGVIGNTLLVALPEGYYTLSADAFSHNQKEVPEEGITGIELMASNGSVHWGVAVANGNTVPQHFSVNFPSDGKAITTVGLLIRGTNANWVVADNFRLEYIGTTVPDAIQAVEANVDEKAAFIYNLAGQRVSRAVRGLYIVGKKKMMVK